MSSAQCQKQIRRDKRVARYEEVQTLSKQGMGIREIARHLKMSRQTIRRFVHAEEFPESASGKRGERGSILNQYKFHIFQRWRQGCRNSVQFYDEIKARRYSGSASLLRNFLARLRKKHWEAESEEGHIFDTVAQAIETSPVLPPKQRVARRMFSAHASWLMVSQLKKLSEKQQKHVESIRKAHPDLELAYQLGQEFVMMLAEHRAAVWFGRPR